MVAIGFASAQFFDPTPGLWKVGVVNAIAAPIFAAIPLLHRFGALAAPIAGLSIVYAFIFLVVFLLGTGTGMQLYYLVTVALAVMFFGPERVFIASAFGIGAAALLIALELLVPHNTGTQTAATQFGNFVTTVATTVVLLLTIVFYLLREAERAEAAAEREAERVEVRNRFIRETFGRYLSDEVVTTLLESPTGLEIGGEKRKVTMMMADLRGFTSLSERLPPELVVNIINLYLATMVKIIKRYEGTIDEFIGDAIFVLFGAPVQHSNDAQRAVACAIAMQLAMVSVNQQNRENGWPEIEMGIGINTGQVVLGNIGSPDRLKYGVVGSHVNLTSRIQSSTTGGQILVSEATRRELESMFVLGETLELNVKGIEQPVTVSEVLGPDGPQLFLLRSHSHSPKDA